MASEIITVLINAHRKYVCKSNSDVTLYQPLVRA